MNYKVKAALGSLMVAIIRGNFQQRQDSSLILGKEGDTSELFAPRRADNTVEYCVRFPSFNDKMCCGDGLCVMIKCLR